MAKYLFVYRTSDDPRYKMSPEQMQEHHQKWVRWFQEGIEKGWVVDTGDGLQREGRVINAEKVVTDGPLIEAKEMIGGFTLMQAATIDDAAEIAKGCPVFATGGSVEVRPMWGFTMDV